MYLRASNNEEVALEFEAKKYDKNQRRKYLSKAMFKTLNKSLIEEECQLTLGSLIKYGADINYIHNNSTLFLSALKKKLWLVARWILDYYPNLSLRDSLKRSCIHILIENYQKNTYISCLFDHLLNQKANLFIEDNEGNTSLHTACIKLWVSGVSKLAKFKGLELYKNSITLDTPIHLLGRIIEPQAIECIQRLLDINLSINTRDEILKILLAEADLTNNITMKEFVQDYKKKIANESGSSNGTLNLSISTNEIKPPSHYPQGELFFDEQYYFFS